MFNLLFLFVKKSSTFGAIPADDIINDIRNSSADTGILTANFFLSVFLIAIFTTPEAPFPIILSVIL